MSKSKGIRMIVEKVEGFPNPMCQAAHKCLKMCRLCIVKYYDKEHKLRVPRPINLKSLFGNCRLQGFCDPKCGLCKTLAYQAVHSKWAKDNDEFSDEYLGTPDDFPALAPSLLPAPEYVTFA